MRSRPASQRTLLHAAGESSAGKSPGTPSIVSRTCKPKPAGHAQEDFWEILHTRTVSPSTHPRPASGGATDFLPASALSLHQQALRPPGGEDARCVQPMSATQTNCVHPHLAHSRLRTQLSLRGPPAESSAPRGTTGGPDASRHPRPLRWIAVRHMTSVLVPYGPRT